MDNTKNTANINTTPSINSTELNTVIEDTIKTDDAKNLDATVANPVPEHTKLIPILGDVVVSKDHHPSPHLLDSTYIIEYHWNNKKTLIHDYEIEESQQQLKENNILILIDFSNTENTAEVLFITNHDNLNSYLFVNPEVCIDYDICYSTEQDIIII